MIMKAKSPKIIIAAGVLISIVAALRIAMIVKNYSDTEKLYDDTVKAYVNHMPSGSYDEESQTDSDGVPTESHEVEGELIVDFDAIRKINPDVIGWIYSEDGSINYPVLYSGDNDRYLRRTYTGKYATAGSIFLEGECNPDWSDYHTIVYGHNMNDGSMFGKLKNYANVKGYADSHRFIRIRTLEEEYLYAVVSYKEVAVDDEIYTVYKDSGDGLSDFIRYHIMRGTQAQGVSVLLEKDAATCHVLTLSTCSKGDSRFVVSAIRLD